MSARRRRLRARLKQLRRRPRPLNPSQLNVGVLNLDKGRAGDWLYIMAALWVLIRLGGPGALCLVETKQGRENVRMIGVGIRLRKRRMVPVGDVGVHRDVEIAEIRLGRRRAGRRRKVGLVVNHAPHRKTIATREDPTGQRGQDSYFVALKEDVLDDFDTVIQAGDQNNDSANVAAIVGGTPFGAPGDVMGGTVRGGLTIVRQWATDIGRDPKRRWTGHREAWVTVQLTA